jgi:hypothetical protein
MNRKHLLPLFLMVMMILSIIPNVKAGTSITFKSFCANNGNLVQTLNCTLSGVSTSDTIIVNLFGIGIFNGFTVTDGQSNTYSQKVLSLTGSGAGTSTYIYGTLSTSGSGSLLVTVATGGANRIYGFTASDYSGVLGFGKTGTDQQDSAGASGTTTVSLTGVGSASLMIDDGYFEVNIGGGSPTVSQNNGQSIRDTTGCNLYICRAGDGTSPTLGWSWSGGTGCPCFVSHSVLELTGTINTNPVVSQCYGNCGNPPVTAVNTNSTHTINFNVSQTYMYISQVQITGFIQNMTMNIACNPTPFGPCKNNQPFLGLYLTGSSCVGATAFTAQCPGQLITSSTSSTFVKGKFTQPLSNIPVNTGQWIGVAFSASQSGFDINDTNTNVAVVNTAGIMPLSVISVTSQGNLKANVYAWIVGQVPFTGGPPAGPTGPCGLLDCVLLGLIQSGCGIQTQACLIGAGFFWMVILSGVVIGMVMWGEGKLGMKVIPGQFFMFVPLSFTFLFFEIGIFPFWVPVFMFIVVLLLFASMLKGTLDGKGMTL